MKVGLVMMLCLTIFSLSSQAQCRVNIPADAQTVKSSGLFTESKNYWVCTHSFMQFKGNGATIYVEPRGKLIVEGDSNTVYIKAKVKFVVKGKGNKIIHQGWQGAEKDSLNELIKCPFILYEYGSASSEGCPEFNKEDYQRPTYYIVQGEQTLIMDTLTIPQKDKKVLKDSAKTEEIASVHNIKTEPKFEDIKEEDLFVGEKIALNNVLFDRGKYVLNSSSFAELNKLADLMKRTPKMKVQLEGHTDITGSDKQNMQLSKHRVLVVKHYLEGKGIKGKRIATQAFGSSKPLVENLDEKSRSLNRRVEMKILEL